MFGALKEGKRNRAGKCTWWGRKLRSIWAKNPNCHYCGCMTIVDNKFENNNNQKRNAATLDHTYSNIDIRRLIKGANHKLVLSCFACNQKRNDNEVRRVYRNCFDMRNNRVSVVEILKTGNIPSFSIDKSNFK